MPRTLRTDAGLLDGRVAAASQARAGDIQPQGATRCGRRLHEGSDAAWPDDRKVVDLGTLTIDKTVANNAAAEKPLLFLPGQLTDGIEPSDDPLIDVRDGAYPVSFSRRNP